MNNDADDPFGSQRGHVDSLFDPYNSLLCVQVSPDVKYPSLEYLGACFMRAECFEMTAM